MSDNITNINTILSIFVEEIVNSKPTFNVKNEIKLEIDKIIEMEIDKFSFIQDDIKDFIRVGEYIFPLLNKSPFLDYSSCVIQHSKALENILFESAFSTFIHDYIYSDRDASEDINDRALEKFCKQIKKGYKIKILSFGEIINVFKNVNSQKKLLQNYKIHIDKNNLSIIYEELIDDLEYIRDCRNKASHNEKIDRYEFIEVRKKIFNIINILNSREGF